VHLPRAAEARTILSELVSETPVYLDDYFTSEQIDAWPEHHGTSSPIRTLRLWTERHLSDWPDVAGATV
jgi:hypothetical protein